MSPPRRWARRRGGPTDRTAVACQPANRARSGNAPSTSRVSARTTTDSMSSPSWGWATAVTATRRGARAHRGSSHARPPIAIRISIHQHDQNPRL